MSSDGEINVAVKAEGVDEAVAEMEGDGGGGTISKPKRKIGGGGKGLLSGGLMGLVAGMTATLTAIAVGLGAIVGLIAAMPGMLKFIKGIFKVLQAFLAPLSLMLMRLLMPVLRMMISLLPAWFDFMESVDTAIGNMVGWIKALPGNIWDFVKQLAKNTVAMLLTQVSWLADGAENIGEAVWDFMEDLPGLIAQKLKESVPGGGGNILPGDGPGGLPTFSDIGASIGENFGSDGQSLNPVNIAISGGLEPFVSEVTRNNSIDWP